jgi:hypothetical protein
MYEPPLWGVLLNKIEFVPISGRHRTTGFAAVKKINASLRHSWR